MNVDLRGRRRPWLAAALATAMVATLATSSEARAGGPAAQVSSSQPNMATRDSLRLVSAGTVDLSGTTSGAASPFVCAVEVERGSLELYNFELDLAYSLVSWKGQVSCSNLVGAIAMRTHLISRTPDHDGETMKSLPWQYASGVNPAATGKGSIDLFDVDDLALAPDTVEVTMEIEAVNPYGTFTTCGSPTGLRVITCSGLGSSNLKVVYGTRSFATQKGGLCFNPTPAQASTLGVEERRLTKTVQGGKEPVALQLMRLSRLVNITAKLKSRLVSVTTLAAARAAVEQEALRLWNSAVTAAKAAPNSPGLPGDDRPLYWARLCMSATIKLFPTATGFAITSAQRAELAQSLEDVSRGITSSAFTSNGLKRILVSGFDPFDLDYDPTANPFGELRRANPSAASVLRLDGKLLVQNGVQVAEVQTVIFPVRYADFDAGMVERVFGPRFTDADLIVTASQNPTEDFELEVYNGRNRSAGSFKDNNGVDTTGTPSSPLEPPGMPAGPEFTESTLPYDTIAYRYMPNVFLGAEADRGYDLAPGTGLAANGSGGGFLSNEIAYRVTRLRDQYAAPVPAGHIHVPFLNYPPLPQVTGPELTDRRNQIGARFEEILIDALAKGFSLVNSASFEEEGAAPTHVAKSSLATAYKGPGSDFTDQTVGAPSTPLPTILGDVTVELYAGSSWIRLPLLYVSPGQINLLVPNSVGRKLLRINKKDGTNTIRSVTIGESAPGIFAATGNGQGPIKGLLYVTGAPSNPVRATYKTVGTDIVNDPVPLTNSARVPNVVVFYATGLGGHPATVTIGGTPQTVDYSGPAPGYVGLDQINIRLNPDIDLSDFPFGNDLRVVVSTGINDSGVNATISLTYG